MPVDCGSMTPSRAQAATAASAAVPPARITSIATSAACGCDVATMAFWAWTVERPAKWKFLITTAFFLRFPASGCRSEARPRDYDTGLRYRGFLAYSSRAGQWLACQRIEQPC